MGETGRWVAGRSVAVAMVALFAIGCSTPDGNSSMNEESPDTSTTVPVRVEDMSEDQRRYLTLACFGAGAFSTGEISVADIASAARKTEVDEVVAIGDRIVAAGTSAGQEVLVDDLNQLCIDRGYKDALKALDDG